MRPDPVIYQIYPRSFQDSDGDGVGDLAGMRARLDHLVDLGVDALWLSPIYPSPMADFGYDVSDYTAVDPVFGTLADFDALVAAAHERGLELLLDLVPCHTSIEHPWFREHPDWYIWADAARTTGSRRSAAPPGRRTSGRWYLHSFYPEQPDLDWRNPEVVAAMQDVIRFWLDRGVDGFRIDAIDRLLKDPRAARRPAGHRAVRPAAERGRGAARAHATRATRRTSGRRSARIREAAGDALLVGRGLPPERAAGSPTSSTSTPRSPSSCSTRRWDAGGAARGDRGRREPRRRPPG